jgi:hypothetical protein
MKSYIEKINKDGSNYGMYCNLQFANSVTEEKKVMHNIITSLIASANIYIEEAYKKAKRDGFRDDFEAQIGYEEMPILGYLSLLCEKLDKKLVVFFDDVDLIQEQALRSFLEQIRVGITHRETTPFPCSIAMIGMNNICDYKINVGPGSDTQDSDRSYNMIKESLTLCDFTESQINELYSQHTEATGQLFADEAISKAWYWSEGQPWLVNALASEVVENILDNDNKTTITSEHIDQAANNIMEKRGKHIDSFLCHLNDPRVWRIVEPMLATSDNTARQDDSTNNSPTLNNDLDFCKNMGIVKEENGLRPANPIYACTMVRYLNWNYQSKIDKELGSKWMDGKNIDMSGLLREFQKFWANNSEKYLSGFPFVEAGPHILLSAFLQRMVYGVGVVINKFAKSQACAGIVVQYAGNSYIIGIKDSDITENETKNVDLISRYMNDLLSREGWLVVFDRKSKESWENKIFWSTNTMPGGEIIHVIGC